MFCSNKSIHFSFFTNASTTYAIVKNIREKTTRARRSYQSQSTWYPSVVRRWIPSNVQLVTTGTLWLPPRVGSPIRNLIRHEDKNQFNFINSNNNYCLTPADLVSSQKPIHPFHLLPSPGHVNTITIYCMT